MFASLLAPRPILLASLIAAVAAHGSSQQTAIPTAEEITELTDLFNTLDRQLRDNLQFIRGLVADESRAALAQDCECALPYLRAQRRRWEDTEDARDAFSRVFDGVLLEIQNVSGLAERVRELEETLRDLENEVSIADRRIRAAAASLQQREQQVTEATAELSQIRSQQARFILHWLLDNAPPPYQSPPTTIGGNVIVIINTLVGTFFARYEHELSPDQTDEPVISFTPAAIPNAILGGVTLSLTPSDPGALRNMTFQTDRIEDGYSGPFDYGQPRPISLSRTTKWIWDAVAQEGFRGANFSVPFDASLVVFDADPVDFSVPAIPFEIDAYRPTTESWGQWGLEILQAWLMPAGVGVFGGVVGFWIGGSRRRRVGF